MEQKILTWSRDSVDYIGTQLKDYLDQKCTDGWYVHQILPTISDKSFGSRDMMLSCIIILNRRLNKIGKSYSFITSSGETITKYYDVEEG